MYWEVYNAAKRNDFEKVKMFIEEGGVSPTIKYGMFKDETLAHTAAMNGCLDTLKYLLEKEPSLLSDNEIFRLSYTSFGS